MKNIVLIGSREGTRFVHTIERYNQTFNVSSLAEDLNLVAEKFKDCKISAIDLFSSTSDFCSSNIKEFLNEKIEIFDVESLDSKLQECDGIVLVGCPAKAGTKNSFLARTLDNSIFEYFINNESIGLIGIFKLIADFYNKPILFITGDEAAVLEAKSIGIKGICVKKATGINYCMRIEKEDFVHKIDEIKLDFKHINVKFNNELNIIIEFIRSDFAFDFYKRNSGFTFLDKRTLSKKIKFKKANDILFLRGTL